MERRSTPTAVKIVNRDDEPPKIRGIAARYYDPADEGTQYELWPGVVERIMPGAFDRTAKGDDVVALFNHDPSLVLGRRSAKTLKLFLRKDGIHYHITPPDTAAGRDTIESIRRGDVQGSSFGFMAMTTEWKLEDGVDVRELHDVQLIDVSPVTFPAYTSTSVGVRSAELDSTYLGEARQSYDSWKDELRQQAENARAERRTYEARLRLAEIL